VIRRLTMAAFLAAACLAPIFTASHANATALCRYNSECLYVYYSTASHTTAIGDTSVSCSGQATTVGKTSPYVVFSESECNL
jgi:hypothetical protein